MKLADKTMCTGCGACASVCPCGAIEMVQDEEGFFVPHINDEKCNKCGACEKACHVSKEYANVLKTSKFYACRSKDAGTVKTSSSGGVFTELSNKVLKDGGVVFGAAFSNDYKGLTHTSTDEVTLEQLKRSKYFESDMGLTIKRIGEELKADRTVLFCGTPCQAMGVRATFGERFENLIIVDFLCHGVPSQKTYKKYIADIEKKYNSEVVDVNFRPKTFGWRTYCMSIKFANGKKYIKLGNEDPFFRIFFSKKVLRDCCYTCNKQDLSAADITIGDFWGISKMTNMSDDDKGMSLVSLHSEKGKKLFKECIDFKDLMQLSLNDVIYAYNRPERKRPEVKMNIDTFDFFNNDLLKKSGWKKKLRNAIIKNELLRKILKITG